MLAILGTTLAILIQALGIWGAIDVVMKGRTAQGAVAWAISLLFLPIIALPLYLMFGDRRFQGYVRARRDGVRQIDHAAAELFEALKPFKLPPDEQHSTFTALGRLARLPFTIGNAADLLIDGAQTFPAMLAAIDSATDYVLVQFYIIREDEVGTQLESALLRARARNVRVHLLYDEIGSYGLPRAYLDRLTAAGCQCSGFRTKPRKQKPFRINFRNHRKIVVVDGRIAFTGGLNVGREYLGRDEQFGPWRDTHVRLRGPAALCLQLAFLEDWYWANRNTPKLNWTPEPASVPPTDTSVLIVPSGPADLIETGTLMHTMIINTARRRLWLATPYFVPDEQIVGALHLAALRGVDVRLIIPERNDSAMIHYSMLSYYEDLLPVGIRVFRYQKGFMHQKVMLCDDLSVIGTANLDNRSLRINFEVSAIIAEPTFASGVETMLTRDLEFCTELPRDAATRLSLWTRFLARVSRLFAPIQ